MSGTEREKTDAAAEPWVDQATVARHLGISARTVEGWRLRREGPPFARLGGSIRYRLSEVDRWAERMRPRTQKRSAQAASA